MKKTIISGFLAAYIGLFVVGIGVFGVTTLAPNTVSAQTTNYKGLVQCDGVVTDPSTQKKCDFNALIDQINFLINWAFFMAIPIASGFLVYAGYYYMFTGEEGHKKAKAIFSSVGIGLIAAAGGWLVIHTIIKFLVKPGLGAGSLIGS